MCRLLGFRATRGQGSGMQRQSAGKQVPFFKGTGPAPVRWFRRRSAVKIRRRAGKTGSCHRRTGCDGALPAGCKQWRGARRNTKHPAQHGWSTGTCNFQRHLPPICNSPHAGETSQPCYVSFKLKHMTKAFDHPQAGEDPISLSGVTGVFCVRGNMCIPFPFRKFCSTDATDR